MRLARRQRAGMLITMTPLVDVMLIMLIFFMVTSSYLDLDMIPLVGAESPGTELQTTPAASGKAEQTASSGTLLVRLSADGRSFVAGQPMDREALQAVISVRIAGNAAVPILILPSPAATTQALVTLMDGITEAGATNVRVVRFEAR